MTDIDRDYRVLLVEDSEEDATWIKLVLGKAERVTFVVDHVEWLSNAMTAAENRSYDVVLLDLGLPDSRGLETLTTFLRAAGSTPIIVLTGHDEMQLAMDCLEQGAQDFQLKSDVRTRPMERAILYAIQRRHHEMVSKELLQASLSQISGDHEAPQVMMLREHCSKIVEALDDVRGYLRRNTPAAAEDVDAILEAHHMGTVIKEMRDVLSPRRRKRRSSVKEMAHATLSDIQRSSSSPPPSAKSSTRTGAKEDLLAAIEELSEPVAGES